MNLKLGIAVLIIALIVPSAQPYVYRGYDRSSDPNFDMFGRSVAGDNAYRQPLRTLKSPAPMIPPAMPPRRRPMYVPPRVPIAPRGVPMRPPVRPPVGPEVLQTQPIMQQQMPYHYPHYYPGYDPPSYDPPDISMPDPPSDYYYGPRPNLGIYNPSQISAFNRAYLR